MLLDDWQIPYGKEAWFFPDLTLKKQPKNQKDCLKISQESM